MARKKPDNRWRTPPPSMPGVRAVQREDAVGSYWVFVIRWKDPATGSKLAETCDTPTDALDFKAHLRLLKRRGQVADLNRGLELLDDFASEWLQQWAKTNLSARTLGDYAQAYDRLISPRVGQVQLRQLRPKIIDQLKNDLLADGYGNATVLKALAALSSMLSIAVVWERIDSNPVRAIRKPPAKRTKIINPLSIADVERLLAALHQQGDETGAMLAELMAYTGARPQDALAARFDQITKTQIQYTHKIIDGRRVPGSKTGQDKTRTVALLPIVRRDLLTYRAALPGATAHGLIIPSPGGTPWDASRYRNWTTRKARGTRRNDGQRTGPAGSFHRAVLAAGLPPDTTPYFLRHTWASIRLAEQRLSLKEISDELGHSLQTLAEKYAHVISEYAGQGPIDPDHLIRATRSGTPKDSKRTLRAKGQA